MKPKFKIGELVKIKRKYSDVDYIYEIENVYKFRESIHYNLKNYLYPYPEKLLESIDRNEKLEIIIKDNCKMIDVLVAGLAKIIRKNKKVKVETKKDRYWEGYDDGRKSSLNHNIILMNAQLKSHKEFRK